MRTLATLALILATSAARAETGPPTAAEVAKAEADCMAVVAPACLFTLALDQLLPTLPTDRADEMSILFLNGLANTQIRAGDHTAALRTLGLTETLPETLLNLGRWDEAWAKAQSTFAGREPEIGTTPEGNFKRQMVIAMLARDDTKRALATARSIAAKGSSERDNALLDIVTHTAAAGDLATAIQAAGAMQEPPSPFFSSRETALLIIVEAQAKAGAMADAEALLDRIGHPPSNLRARLVLAKAWHDAGSDTKAERQFDLVLERIPQGLAANSWVIEIVIDSADLALSLGMTPTARQQALAAFTMIDRQEIGSNDVLNQGDLLRLATILENVGAPGKAAAMRSAGSRPVGDEPWLLPSSLDQLILQLQSQLLRKDRVAADAILLNLRKTMLTHPHLSGSEQVAEVVQVLLSAGLHSEARKFADDVPAHDDRAFDLAPAYVALVAHDLSLAPDLLLDIADGWTKLQVSLIWAVELAKAGRQAEARDVLRTLLAQMTPCGNESLDTYRVEGGTRPDVIAVQDRLGYAEDAGLARQECLSRILAAEHDPKDVYYRLMSLAGTFS